MKKLKITAQWLTQFIVCFLASIGRFFRVDIYGRTEHYRQMLAAHLAGWSLPSTRAIQKGYNWLCNKMDQLKDAAKEKLKRSQWESMCDEITALLGLELQTMTAK